MPNLASTALGQVTRKQMAVQWLCLMFPLQETKPHIQELSIKTTIISRYAFTAVYCAVLNRHSAATEGVFQFQIPAGAYVSNFTM